MKNKTKRFLFGLMAAVAVEVAAGVEPAPEMQYARLVERELAGEISLALIEYRALLAALPTGNMMLMERLLYRIGVCEKRLGHPEQAREAWRRLVDTCPPQDPQVEAARVALKNLERELDRVVMKGKIRVQGSGVRIEDSEGRRQPPEPRTLNPEPLCFVLAGEWGNEPPAQCDTNGVFMLERKVAGRLRDGRRYGYVLAEHPFRPWVGGGVWVEGAVTNVIAVGGDAPAFSGRVVDGRGKAVQDALVRVMGYAEVGGEEIPLPFDNLLPPCFSGTNGEFLVTGLVPGCRYVFTAEKNGWRLSSAAEQTIVNRGGPAPLPLPPVVLQSLGDISLRGRVVDEAGRGVSAEVAALAGSPGEHQLARVKTDQDGQFLFRDLRESLVAIRVESVGFSPRLLPGIKPMGQEIDVVVKGGAGSRAQGSGFSNPKGEDLLMSSLRPQPPASEQLALSGNSATQKLGNYLSFLEWIRGNPESGERVREEDLRGHVVVLHSGSAYVESSLRSQYPREPGVMSLLMETYGARGLICIWVLPEGEKQGESARMALELYPDLPVAYLKKGGVGVPFLPEAGNMVVGRDGSTRAACSDLQLFKAVKAAIISPE